MKTCSWFKQAAEARNPAPPVSSLFSCDGLGGRTQLETRISGVIYDSKRSLCALIHSRDFCTTSIKSQRGDYTAGSCRKFSDAGVGLVPHASPAHSNQRTYRLMTSRCAIYLFISLQHMSDWGLRMTVVIRWTVSTVRMLL